MPSAEFMLWLYKPEHLESCGAAYRKMADESSLFFNTATVYH